MQQRKVIKSYVKRMSRITLRQKNALATLWPKYGLDLEQGELDFTKIFQRQANTVLEIGFGNGDSLLQMAQAYPHLNFIGIEVHLPGLGNLLANLEELNITNVKIFKTDAVEILKTCIPDHSLSHLLLFFPDPWPKTRHHKRRLIQADFVALMAKKLQANGIFHCATDWEEYAKHVNKIMAATTYFKAIDVKLLGEQLLQRALTKFEKRGKKLGHSIWDLFFIKQQE